MLTVQKILYVADGVFIRKLRNAFEAYEKGESNVWKGDILANLLQKFKGKK